MLFPWIGHRLSQFTSEPELGVGQGHDLHPVFLAPNVWRFEGCHQQLLFAKAEVVFFIEALGVHAPGFHQRQLSTTLTQYAQPHWPPEHELSLLVEYLDSDQDEGMLMHRQVFFPSYQLVVPSLQTHLPETSLAASNRNGNDLFRFPPGLGLSKRKPITIPFGVTSVRLAFYRFRLPVWTLDKSSLTR